MKIHPRKFPCHVPFSCQNAIDAARSLFAQISNKTQGLVEVDVVDCKVPLAQQITDLHTGKIQMSMIASRGNVSGKLMDLAAIYRLHNDPRTTDTQQKIFQALWHRVYHSQGEFRTHDRGAIANINKSMVSNLSCYRDLLHQKSYQEPSTDKAVRPSSEKALIGHQTIFIIPTNLVYCVSDDYYLISLLTGYQTWNNLRKPMRSIINDISTTLDTYPKINIDDRWV